MKIALPLLYWDLFQTIAIQNPLRLKKRCTKLIFIEFVWILPWVCLGARMQMTGWLWLVFTIERWLIVPSRVLQLSYYPPTTAATYGSTIHFHLCFNTQTFVLCLEVLCFKKHLHIIPGFKQIRHWGSGTNKLIVPFHVLQFSYYPPTTAATYGSTIHFHLFFNTQTFLLCLEVLCFKKHLHIFPGFRQIIHWGSRTKNW